MMPPLMPLAARMLPDHPGVMQCLEFQLVGLIVVLFALAMLWLICELVGAAFRSSRVKEVPSFGGGDVFDDEAEDSVMRAAIMAAVHAVLGPGHRIVSAAPAEAPPAAAPPVVAGGGDEAALRAAVVSSVHAALGPGHRVVSVVPCRQGSVAAWSAEGRRQHFQSHKVR